MELLLLYWIIVFGLITVGFLMFLINLNNPSKKKIGLRILIVGVILLVIGGSVCYSILTNLRIHP